VTILRAGAGRTRAARAAPEPRQQARQALHLYTALGSFTHTDKAGANSLHFSGAARAQASAGVPAAAVAPQRGGQRPVALKGFNIREAATALRGRRYARRTFGPLREGAGALRR